jgi:hypothetical protein
MSKPLQFMNPQRGKVILSKNTQWCTAGHKPKDIIPDRWGNELDPYKTGNQLLEQFGANRE